MGVVGASIQEFLVSPRRLHPLKVAASEIADEGIAAGRYVGHAKVEGTGWVHPFMGCFDFGWTSKTRTALFRQSMEWQWIDREPGATMIPELDL